MVIKEILSKAISELKNADNENPVYEAHLIIREILNLSPIDLVLKGDLEVSKIRENLIKDAIKRRISHEPLQYILNSQEFMGLSFYVDKNVLVPRQDTEVLVETILEKMKNKSFSALDIGTGSGCIAISLAHYNKNALVRGIDISKSALEVAKKNAKDLGVSERVTFEEQDVFSLDAYGKYDVIVSNPPYIETDVIKTLDKDVKDHEPIGALDGGEDGLSYYRHIVKISPRLLTKSGILAFEVGHTQADAVKKLMENDFSQIEIIKDLCGVKRVVLGYFK